jgi:hypothetical protein
VHTDQGLDALVPDAETADALRPDALLDAQIPDALPDAEVPDAETTDAETADAAPVPQVDGLSLGMHPLNTPIEFELPMVADGLLIQARGDVHGLYGVVDVLGPPGRLVGPAGTGPNRTTLNPHVATALLPNHGAPDDTLPPGTYRFTLTAAQPADDLLEVEVWFKRNVGGLHVNLWLPPDTGRTPDDAAVITLGAQLARRLELDFAFDPVTVQPHLLTAGAPTELALNSLRRDWTALAALAAHRGAAPAGLNVYLVEQITDGASRINGFSGGLPTPFGWPDTAAAVTAVRTPLLDDFPDAVAEMVAHELGHALGLYHTTEAHGGQFDPIPDTPECPEACDLDGDGLYLASECGGRGMGLDPCRGAADNRMFWTLGGLRSFTDGQRRVVGSHPVVGQRP